MAEEKEFSSEDVVADLTKPVKKIWDLVLPESYPYILEFETNEVLKVEKTQKIGPYGITKRILWYDAVGYIDPKPLFDVGWDGKSDIGPEMVEAAYGREYFENLRTRMMELMGYLGLTNVSVFDFKGNLSFNTEPKK